MHATRDANTKHDAPTGKPIKDSLPHPPTLWCLWARTGRSRQKESCYTKVARKSRCVAPSESGEIRAVSRAVTINRHRPLRGMFGQLWPQFNRRRRKQTATARGPTPEVYRSCRQTPLRWPGSCLPPPWCRRRQWPRLPPACFCCLFFCFFFAGKQELVFFQSTDANIHAFLLGAGGSGGRDEKRVPRSAKRNTRTLRMSPESFQDVGLNVVRLDPISTEFGFSNRISLTPGQSRQGSRRDSLACAAVAQAREQRVQAGRCDPMSCGAS